MVALLVAAALVASRRDPVTYADGTPEAAVQDYFDALIDHDAGGEAQQEREEIGIIQAFMPKQLSEDEAKAAVAAVIKAVGAASIKDMGKVMAELKAKHAGQMDFAKAGAIVKSLLG